VTWVKRDERVIYRCHLERRFKDTPLDAIDVSAISQLRADLVEAELSEKRINNILAVLSKPLHYAAECNVIAKVPRMGLFKCERPEIEAWTFDEYARILDAAKLAGEDWYTAVCLAGEAGLRVGEIKTLRWREDVDMIARTITVRQQTCNGVTTTPKGHTRRTIQMTTRLYEALKAMSTIREGFVVRNLDGSQKTDAEANWAIDRICRKAGLPVHYWHRCAWHICAKKRGESSRNHSDLIYLCSARRGLEPPRCYPLAPQALRNAAISALYALESLPEAAISRACASSC
jgi:integrase